MAPKQTCSPVSNKAVLQKRTFLLPLSFDSTKNFAIKCQTLSSHNAEKTPPITETILFTFLLLPLWNLSTVPCYSLREACCCFKRQTTSDEAQWQPVLRFLTCDDTLSGQCESCKLWLKVTAGYNWSLLPPMRERSPWTFHSPYNRLTSNKPCWTPRENNSSTSNFQGTGCEKWKDKRVTTHLICHSLGARNIMIFFKN